MATRREFVQALPRPQSKSWPPTKSELSRGGLKFYDAIYSIGHNFADTSMRSNTAPLPPVSLFLDISRGVDRLRSRDLSPTVNLFNSGYSRREC